MNGAAMTRSRVPQASQVEATVAVRVEARRPVIAALDYVERDSGQI